MKRKLSIVLTIAVILFSAPTVFLVFSGLADHFGKADVALVLGNQVNRDGSPSPRLKARLDKAAELYRDGYFEKVIVSGATGKEGVPEGTAMKRYLVKAGLPGSAIIVDDQGVDTQASARNTVAILKSHHWSSVFVVTQYYHIPRSKLALSKLGVSPIYHAHASYFEIRDIYSTLREIPAYLKYLVIDIEAKP